MLSDLRSLPFKKLALCSAALLLTFALGFYFFLKFKTRGESSCKTDFEVQELDAGDQKLSVWQPDNSFVPPLYFSSQIRKQPNGFVKIERNDQIGYGSEEGLLSPEGKLLFPPIYYEIKVLPDGYFLLKIGQEYLHGVGDNQGRTLLEPKQFKKIHRVYTEERMASVQLYENDKQGVIDFSGKYLIEPKREIIEPIPYSEGFFVIRERYKASFQDRNGGVLKIPNGVQNASPFSNGFAAVQIGGKWGFIDTKGELVIRPEFDSVGEFNASGFARIESAKPGYTPFVGMINRKGTRVIEPKYVNTFWKSDSKFFDAWLDIGSKCGIFRSDGTIALAFEYDRCNWDDNLNYGEARIGENRMILFPSASGKLDSIPIDEVKEKIETRLLVSSGSKLGLLNEFGTTVIPIEYESITSLELEGKKRVFAFSKEETAIFDLDGTAIASFPFKIVSCREKICIGRNRKQKMEFSAVSSPQKKSQEYEQLGEFHEGLARFLSGNKWGFIDSDQKVVIPPVYSNVGNYEGGLAWFKNKQGKYGYINKKGETAIQPTFHAALDFYRGLAAVEVDGNYGIIDTKGTFVIRPLFQSVEDWGTELPVLKHNEKKAVLNLKECLGN